MKRDTLVSTLTRRYWDKDDGGSVYAMNPISKTKSQHERKARTAPLALRMDADQRCRQYIPLSIIREDQRHKTMSRL